MYIKSILLKNFRNYSDLNLNLGSKLNILYGDNAQGKTNILEAIYICAMGRSQKAQHDREIIKLNETEAHIQTYVIDENLESKIDVHLKKDLKKGVAINGLPIKKLSQLLGTIYVVIFSPEDLQLIKNGPSERRKFIDMEICQLSSVYYYNLQQYYKVLKQRNNLLKTLLKNPLNKDTIFVWDKQLVLYGKKIIDARVEFIDKINKIASQIHYKITGEAEKLNIQYMPSIKVNDFELKLTKHLDKDIMYGNTLIGPHKDDLKFYINENDVKIYGSQGQQRTTALSIKLAEIELIKEETSNKPILLLDDVLSELDESRQSYLLGNISDIQTILTCTGIEDSIKKYIHKATVYQIKNCNAQLFV